MALKAFFYLLTHPIETEITELRLTISKQENSRKGTVFSEKNLDSKESNPKKLQRLSSH